MKIYLIFQREGELLFYRMSVFRWPVFSIFSHVKSNDLRLKGMGYNFRGVDFLLRLADGDDNIFMNTRNPGNVFFRCKICAKGTS